MGFPADASMWRKRHIDLSLVVVMDKSSVSISGFAADM
jgi:hypothetical protein